MTDEQYQLESLNILTSMEAKLSRLVELAERQAPRFVYDPKQMEKSLALKLANSKPGDLIPVNYIEMEAMRLHFQRIG